MTISTNIVKVPSYIYMLNVLEIIKENQEGTY